MVQSPKPSRTDDCTDRVMFMYWGRRGALPRFTLDATAAARKMSNVEVVTSISRQNELFPKYQDLDTDLFVVDTFTHGSGAVLKSGHVVSIRRRLGKFLALKQPRAVIDLMPHVWSPFVVSTIQNAGVRYCPVIHDAKAHDGDKSGWTKVLSDQTVPRADCVITLSASVADALVSRDPGLSGKVRILFHPDFTYTNRQVPEAPSPDAPLRLVFLGRIMKYKGLSLLLDAVEHLTAAGVRLELGVFGEGQLGPNAKRLTRLGAEVVNRWLSDDDIGAVLSRYHCVVLPYTAGSQSGIASAAFGAGIPVVATPVGGIAEQVVEGVTGCLASSLSAEALGDAIMRIRDPQTYLAISRNLVATRDSRSMEQFVREVIACTCQR